MSKTPISPSTRDSLPPGFDDGGMDWPAFDAMTPEDVERRTAQDPDTKPLTAIPGGIRRPGFAGTIRFKLRLTLDEFEARYRIPIATVRAWERGEAKPDAAMLAYLTLIAADPDGVAATLSAARVAAE